MRFVFTFPAPQFRCLHASIFIVDKWDKEIKRGDIMAFEFYNENDILIGNNKRNFIKRIAAIGGDTVDIEPTQTKVNNEQPIMLSMKLSAMALKVHASDYKRIIKVPDGHFFAMGETLNSYDSRYWGTLGNEKIIGKAYAIF